MNIPRIYIDTSVIGGCFDSEFAKWSNGLMKDFRLGHFKPVISDLVTAELRLAPQQVKEQYARLIPQCEVISENQKVLSLVSAYKKSKILSDKFENDLTHIALATVFELDLLVSWNFKHIVHFDKIKQFNVVNKKVGYKEIQILSPREVTNYEESI
jgi:hypothetical protein